MQNYRCQARYCSRLLMRAIMAPGVRIEIRCLKCGRTSVFQYQDSEAGKPAIITKDILPILELVDIDEKIA